MVELVVVGSTAYRSRHSRAEFARTSSSRRLLAGPLAAVSPVLFGDRDVVSVCVHASLPAALPHIDGKERQEDSMEGFADRR